MSNDSCIYLDYNGTTPIDPRVGTLGEVRSFALSLDRKGGGALSRDTLERVL